MIHQLTHFALLCLAALPVWLIVRRPWQRRDSREIVLGLFIAYIAALLAMALEGTWTSPAGMLQSAQERIQSMTNIHLTPLSTIRQQVKALPSEDALTQLLGNTLLFAPWGFFLPLLWPRFRKPLPMVCMCLLLTCFIELTQLFIQRIVDVDDLILNFLGAMSGTGIWWIVRRVRRE